MQVKYVLYSFLIAFCFTGFSPVFAENERIRNIFIEKKEVFEKTDPDWFFASKFLNSLHTLTKDYVIKSELLFEEGNEISEDLFLETERNLRTLGLFSGIVIELAEIPDSTNRVDVYVTTKDMWSLYPSLALGANGGEYQLGAGIKDYNLAGHGILLSIGGTYLFKKDTTGYTALLEIEKKRLLGSDLDLLFAGYKTFLHDSIKMSVSKPFRTVNTKTAFGISALNTNGNEYFINKNSSIFNEIRSDTANPAFATYIDSLSFIANKEQNMQFWYSTQWLSGDRVYLSALLDLQKSNRGLNIFDRAYDNQGKFLIGFSSISQTFHTVSGIEAYCNSDLAVGGWGNVILGAIFPVNKYGEKGLFYVGAQAEKSHYSHNFYLFGQVTAASSFSSDFAKYTYQEFLGLAFVRLSNKLVFAVRILEQASWNYPRMRQLFLDDFRGIRGYDLQKMAGDNRFISNIELRYFPNFRISVMQFSGVLFYDIGAIWNQRVEDAFFGARFYSSVGAGLRGHFTKSDNPDHTLRLDIPYNLTTKQFGISIGVRQYFSATSSHAFRLPAIYNSEFNAE